MEDHFSVRIGEMLGKQRVVHLRRLRIQLQAINLHVIDFQRNRAVSSVGQILVLGVYNMPTCLEVRGLELGPRKDTITVAISVLECHHLRRWWDLVDVHHR